MADGGIVSSSYDGTIKIWDSDRGVLVKTLQGHDDGVVCMDLFGDK